ncbi:MAG: hypothetical protein ACLP9L_26000 [Thermoguttaceae bacterium]
MKSTKHVVLTILALAALSGGVWAQTSDATAPAPKKKHKAVAVAAAPAQPTVTAADVQALKDALAAQQQQIQQLTQQLQQNQQNWQQAQAAATDAANKAAAAQTQASQEQQTVGELKGDVADLKTNLTTAAMSLQETQKTIDSTLQNPLSIHYKGITFSTSAFVAAEFVRRSRELGGDVTTPFNSLTMPGASQSNLSEFFGSARQSRPTLFVVGRLKNVELSSYISADFLSAGVTSTATQTNSYTLRLRQAWGQAKFDNGWKFLGGQMWSLVTEGKAGIAPSDDLGKVNDARPSTIDAGYNVGFTFARQYGIRLTKDFGNRFSVAVALENAEGTLTTHGNADNFLLGEAGDSKSYNTTGTYTANPSPDIIAKVAFDPGFGHYEVFGLVDRFTDRIFPCVLNYATAACGSLTAAPTTAINAYNASKEGGGIGANARWALANKHIVFGLHGFGGSGVGRYGAAQLSDLSINANGTIHMIKGLQGLTTLEYHGKKLDLYSYVGAEYAGRADGSYVSPSTGKTVYVGYGSPYLPNYGCYTELPPTVNTGFSPTTPANCTGDTRAAIEGTAGFWYTFYSGPKGRFRFGTQYSYVTRQTWSGATAAPTGGTATPGALSPEGLDGMVFTSFRYYLP